MLKLLIRCGVIIVFFDDVVCMWENKKKQALPVFFVYAFKSDGSRKTSRAVSAIAFAAV